MVNKPQNTNRLFLEIKLLIEEARQKVAVAVNAKEILYALSRQLNQVSA